ncbi:MAG: FHA domain-containing serine/threonine-protein kinase [Tychonema bourrellyi B0820]|uniref:Serine/threonine protein kinase n=1 Tax=Tychonema bourrellyi FEM_GT703 TaxID=2040638 RepID=A0A2G4EY34_9CYAN|nr:FHA domain-containing serine/threonine-protein kinase [Tychonema bourrellyi]MDQ2096466.1 FHA domain-containing serine/threonine-protein kinase [Tychonema bourrellyi B0820]PHX54444.1 serine/threonine protein kinase [Tychonema bourrellyi FEM_GT703]
MLLTLLDPEQNTPLQQWSFESESIVRIGRSPENHIVIPNALVSRQHLELQRIKSGVSSQWYLVNSGTNGTFVNGMPLSQGWISDGALIQLARGGPLLHFQVTTIELGGKIGTMPPMTRPSPVCTHAGNPPGSLFCIRCGEPMTVDRTVRNYQVLRTLGQGGMGTTTLAWDREKAKAQKPGSSPADSLVVLKEMNADMAQIAKAQELFEREAKTLKSLNHPGIPKFFDFFVEGGKKYLVMEMLHGEDLEKRIYNRGPVPPQQAIEWMIQTCEVLGYIHSQNPPLVHRDIKPANLLVRHRDNGISVIDFGAVKEIGTPPGTRIGVEGYTAPEQDRGQPLPQSDLYAIGPTLIFLLTASSPQKYYGKIAGGYGFKLENIPTVGPKLRDIILKTTAAKPGDRFQTAKQLAQSLSACL